MCDGPRQKREELIKAIDEYVEARVKAELTRPSETKSGQPLVAYFKCAGCGKEISMKHLFFE